MARRNPPRRVYLSERERDGRGFAGLLAIVIGILFRAAPPHVLDHPLVVLETTGLDGLPLPAPPRRGLPAKEFCARLRELAS